MRKVGLAVLLASIAFGYGSPVLAQETGTVQEGGASGGEGKRGGAALDHRSQKANENSNAQWSTGATKGKDRADLRHQQKADKKQGKKNGDKHRDQDDDDEKGRGHKNDDSDKHRGHDKDDDGGKAQGHNKNHGGKGHGHGKNK